MQTIKLPDCELLVDASDQISVQSLHSPLLHGTINIGIRECHSTVCDLWERE
jgi:hypothetical protein